jgi:hypothetical protein
LGPTLTNKSIQPSATHAGSGLSSGFPIPTQKGRPGREESKNFGRRMATNGNNFADKRDKGFLFSLSSIASLHASGLNCERKKVIFLTGYFGKQNASDPFNTDKHTVTKLNLQPFVFRET